MSDFWRLVATKELKFQKIFILLLQNHFDVQKFQEQDYMGWKVIRSRSSIKQCPTRTRDAYMEPFPCQKIPTMIKKDATFTINVAIYHRKEKKNTLSTTPQRDKNRILNPQIAWLRSDHTCGRFRAVLEMAVRTPQTPGPKLCGACSVIFLATEMMKSLGDGGGAADFAGNFSTGVLLHSSDESAQPSSPTPASTFSAVDAVSAAAESLLPMATRIGVWSLQMGRRVAFLAGLKKSQWAPPIATCHWDWTLCYY